MSSLKRVVGLPGAILLGMGSIVGTGAFVALGLAAEPAGSWLPAAILVAGALALCNGLSSAQLAAHFPVSGGTYEYGYRALSPFWGRAAGAGFLLAKSASAATAALGLSAYLGLGTEAALIVVVIVSAAILGGLQRTQWLNAALVGISLLSLGVFCVAGWFETVPVVPSSPGVGGVFEAAALVFVAFTGYGRVATLGEEIEDPARNIPRAVILTLVVALILYLAVAQVALGLGGVAGFYQGAVEGAPLQLLSHHRLPLAVEALLRVGAVTAMAGVVLNLILGLSRVALAMGRRGDLPGFLGWISPQGVPVPAVLAVTVGVVVLILKGSIAYNWGMSAVAVLGYYAITNGASLVLKTPRFPRWISGLGLAGCLLLSVAVRSGTFVTALGIWAGAVAVLTVVHRLWGPRPGDQ